MDQNDITGTRLRALRIAHKLTQQDMANKFFITRSSVANYESGTRRPSYELLRQIADSFQIDICYLLGISENQTALELTKKIISSAKHLTKDGKLDISSLSALHKIMAIEFTNYLRIIDENDKK